MGVLVDWEKVVFWGRKERLFWEGLGEIGEMMMGGCYLGGVGGW